MASEYVGFAKLRPGRIHLLCPACGRKQSNGLRDKMDPPRATLASFLCDRCDSGTKDCDATYRDARGRDLGGRRGHHARGGCDAGPD